MVSRHGNPLVKELYNDLSSRAKEEYITNGGRALEL